MKELPGRAITMFDVHKRNSQMLSSQRCSVMLQESHPKTSKERKSQFFPKPSICFRTHPNASERIRIDPNGSKRVRKLRTFCEHINKSCENVQIMRENFEICFRVCILPYVLKTVVHCIFQRLQWIYT